LVFLQKYPASLGEGQVGDLDDSHNQGIMAEFGGIFLPPLTPNLSRHTVTNRENEHAKGRNSLKAVTPNKSNLRLF
jgi:hypothetical protein